MRGGRWLLIGLILNLGLAVSNVAFLAQPAREQRGDFVQLYTAGTLVRGGEGRRLYDYRLQGERQRALLGGWSFPGGVLPFNYPPHVALLLVPLTVVPLRPAFLVWTAAQAALLILLLRTVWRLTAGQPGRERWLACATVLALPALLLTFAQGAFSLLLLLVVLKVYQALAQGRERPAGLWLALGTLKPQLVVMPVLAALGARRWRAVGVFTAVMAIVVLGSSAALGPRSWLDCLVAVAQAGRALDAQHVHVSATINLKGALVFAFGPAVEGFVAAVGLGGWLLACAATVWLWRRPVRPDQAAFPLRWAATLLLGIFFNLHLYAQEGLMIFAAGLLFDDYLRRSGQPRAGMAALATLGPALWLATEFVVPPRFIRAPVVLQLVLGAWIARALLRERTSGLRRDQPAGASDL